MREQGKRLLVFAFVLALPILLVGDSSGKEARFVDNRDGTVTDQVTGLMWTKNAAPADTAMDWFGGLNYMAGLNTRGYAGYRDWRLPNINELSSLVDRGCYNPSLPPGHPFQSVKAWYWTGTTKAGYKGAAWRVYFFLGNIDYLPKKHNKSHLWPVRGRKAKVARSGQVCSYYLLDDGALKMGRPWPEPRFKDHGDGIVTDRLTGLMWLKDPSGEKKDWRQALIYVQGMNTRKVAGYSDWRMPQVKELQTLFDYSRSYPVLPLGHPFSGVNFGWYWSQDRNVQDDQYVWAANLATGAIDYYHRKHHQNYVWPVRDHRP